MGCLGGFIVEMIEIIRAVYRNRIDTPPPLASIFVVPQHLTHWGYYLAVGVRIVIGGLLSESLFHYGEISSALAALLVGPSIVLVVERLLKGR